MVVGKNFLVAETLGEVAIGLDAAIAEERPPAAYLLRAATSAAIWRSSWGRDLQFRHEPPTFNRVLEVVFLPKLQALRRFFVKTGLFLKQFHSLTAVADDVDTRRKLVTSGAIDVIVR